MMPRVAMTIIPYSQQLFACVILAVPSPWWIEWSQHCMKWNTISGLPLATPSFQPPRPHGKHLLQVLDKAMVPVCTSGQQWALLSLILWGQMGSMLIWLQVSPMWKINWLDLVFINDADLVVHGPEVSTNNLPQTMQRLVDCWGGLLHATRGALVPTKCFLVWNWLPIEEQHLAVSHKVQQTRRNHYQGWHPKMHTNHSTCLRLTKHDER